MSAAGGALLEQTSTDRKILVDEQTDHTETVRIMSQVDVAHRVWIFLGGFVVGCADLEIKRRVFFPMAIILEVDQVRSVRPQHDEP